MYEKHYEGVSKGGMSNQIMKLLKEYFFEKDFLSLLNANPIIIAYKNGVLNLETLEFRQGIFPHDFLTKVLPYSTDATSFLKFIIFFPIFSHTLFLLIKSPVKFLKTST